MSALAWPLHPITPLLWEIPPDAHPGMRAPARVYATAAMLDEILRDRSLEQLVNVATLPGIAGWALAMPDAHEGYGFPVGGVAAFDAAEGVISPGGIGYDINCGVRLLRSRLGREDAVAAAQDLGRTLFASVPSGVGRGGFLRMRGEEMDAVLEGGARRMLELGYASERDLEHTESGGTFAGAGAGQVSEHARARGAEQLGTMGAGNHFVEVGYVDEVLDPEAAARFGLEPQQVTVLIHTGSRGLGHQVATDFIRRMNQVMPGYGISLPDRELACAPFASADGQAYFAAMAAAANFAWANRQLISFEVRQAFARVFAGRAAEMDVVYDVAHNIAKVEVYTLQGVERRLVVHRKGATRAFPGDPVLIPGSMGTASYVLAGAPAAMAASFGSSCHGAGRRMSRTRARREVAVEGLRAELRARGITVNAGSRRGLSEEAPHAYKDVEAVVDVIHNAGLARKVARLRPLVVVKG